MPLSPRAKLGLWIGLILFVVVPWSNSQDHTHWSQVQWVPSVTSPRVALDAVLNVLIYVPFGYWFAQQTPPGRGRVWRAVMFAAALSLVTEWSQMYSHRRSPSMRDLLCNVLGAWWGAWRAMRGPDIGRGGGGSSPR